MQKDYEHIILAHGGGGELMGQLLQQHILPKLGNDLLNPLTDSAIIPLGKQNLCLTTDAFVVEPLVFPGGDIGSLSVCGTINDLAVAGAKPLALSLAMVLEEGLPLTTLDSILASIAQAAQQAGVPVATGDTKVIERRGETPAMTITTAGVGIARKDANLTAGRIAAGDSVIINGGIAEHGLAVMSARQGLAFQTQLLSDAVPLNGLIEVLLDSGADVKFMRDPTRGGLAGVLADLRDETQLSMDIDEQAIPLTPEARAAADILGLDPLTVANEGKVVIVVAQKDTDIAMAALRGHPLGETAAVIGKFTAASPALVELVTRAGGRRTVTRPYGEELPRIC